MVRRLKDQPAGFALYVIVICLCAAALAVPFMVCGAWLQMLTTFRLRVPAGALALACAHLYALMSSVVGARYRDAYTAFFSDFRIARPTWDPMARSGRIYTPDA
jgi:hypothetical protein